MYFDNNFIYTKSEGKKYVKAVWWVLEQLQKYLLYANLKKYQFYQEEVRFLGYIISHQGIQIEGKQIKALHDWSEPQSVRDIQLFLEFANFYQQFIQVFSRLATPLTSILKTTSAGPAISAKVGDEEQNSKGIQVDGGEKKPV